MRCTVKKAKSSSSCIAFYIIMNKCMTNERIIVSPLFI